MVTCWKTLVWSSDKRCCFNVTIVRAWLLPWKGKPRAIAPSPSTWHWLSACRRWPFKSSGEGLSIGSGCRTNATPFTSHIVPTYLGWVLENGKRKGSPRPPKLLRSRWGRRPCIGGAFSATSDEKIRAGGAQLKSNEAHSPSLEVSRSNRATIT